jgi:hypothetical protein
MKYLHVPKLFENCAHTRLAGLPKVAKSRGKQDRPAATTTTTGALIGYVSVPGVVCIGRWDGLGVT